MAVALSDNCRVLVIVYGHIPIDREHRQREARDRDTQVAHELAQFADKFTERPRVERVNDRDEWHSATNHLLCPQCDFVTNSGQFTSLALLTIMSPIERQMMKVFGTLRKDLCRAKMKINMPLPKTPTKSAN